MDAVSHNTEYYGSENVQSRVLMKEVNLDWLNFFKNKHFADLTAFEQQLYLLIFIYDDKNLPLSISRVVSELRKPASSTRRAIKNLEKKKMITLKTHLSNEINRELIFIYLKKKLNYVGGDSK
jgi:hypothetical protein